MKFPALLGTCLCVSGALAQAPSDVLVDEFTITFNAYFEHTTPVLESGQTYFMTIDGHYNISSGTYGHKDAAWYYCYSGCSEGCNVNTPCPSMDADHWNASITSLRPDTDVFNADHHYEYTFEGDGSAMVFDFGDSAYGDNGGSLAVSIYQMPTPVPAYVPLEGLVGYWPFDGDVLDASGNGQNGTVYGATLSEDRHGAANACYEFSVSGSGGWGAAQDRIVVPSPEIPDVDAFSLISWVLLEEKPAPFNNRPHTIMGRYNGNGTAVFRHKVDYDGGLWTSLEGLGAYYGGSIGYNEWTHVVLTYDGSTLTHYVNGEVTAENAVTGQLALSGSDLTFGELHMANGHWYLLDGKLDDMAYYDRALTPNEVLGFYQSEQIVPGCMDNAACNFNESATIEDGSCQYLNVLTVEGCLVEDGNPVFAELPSFAQSDATPPAIEGLTFIGTLGQSHFYLTQSGVLPSEWGEIEAMVAPYGGWLADVASEEENQFILEAVYPYHTGWYWIGYSDESSEGLWGWRSGANSDYTNWAQGEPNNNGGGEHWCMVHELTNSDPGTWNDATQENFPMVVEVPVSPYVSWDNGAWGDSTTYSMEATQGFAELVVDGSGVCSVEFVLAVSVECSDPSACNFNPADVCDAGCVYPLLDGDCQAGSAACGDGQVWNPETQTCLTLTMFDSNFDGCITNSDLIDFLAVYGLCMEAESSGFAECGDPVSYQGYVYNTVLIGDQCWFAENLRVLASSAGIPFEVAETDEEWQSLYDASTPAFCYPMFFDLYGEEYAPLYNIHAILGDEFCPVGWHVSTDADWMDLEIELGIPLEALLDNALRADYLVAGAIKDDVLWNGTNETEFSVVPAGEKGGYNGFAPLGHSAAFLTSTQPGGFSSYVGRGLGNGGEISRNYYFERGGYSIRCVKD